MNIVNINIGVLGHVDSGKTSLCKTLSTIKSTACFDKNPQSQERGITLDLGFSSFQIDSSLISSEVKEKLKIGNDSALQFTLVDCPGHASLIRTIICGARIIDLMILVVDINKGIQTQTAECLIIGEILCDKILIVLNKIDMIPVEDSESNIAKIRKKMTITLSKSKFKSFEIVEVAANPMNEKMEILAPLGIDMLKTALLKLIEDPIPKRLEGSKNPFIFAADHCFGIKGQGTILTGTVLSGSVKVGDSIYIPEINTDRKIKSIQMFKRPINQAMQGDRIGISVTKLESKLIERALICHSPSSIGNSNLPLSIIKVGLIQVNDIEYFKRPLVTKSKFHMTIGADTVMAQVTLFSTDSNSMSVNQFDWDNEYNYMDIYSKEKGRKVYMLLELERPVVSAENSIVIGAKLDSDIDTRSCRLAFYGSLLWMNGSADYKTTELPRLKIFKTKSKCGQIERVMDSKTLIVKNLFKKNANIQPYFNKKVDLMVFSADANIVGDDQKSLETYQGVIESRFGQTGKCRIIVKNDLPEYLVDAFSLSKRKKAKQSTNPQESTSGNSYVIKVILQFKRYMYDNSKTIIQ